MPEIIINGITTSLPALEPPTSLLFALNAALEMRTLIADGTIKYNTEGLQKWLTESTHRENRLRKTKVEAITKLLKGERLHHLQPKFKEAYFNYLDSHPEARASYTIAREQVKRNGIITGVHPEVYQLLVP